MQGTLAVCWGVGWDSTAMLIEVRNRGLRPDLITFADVGAEKPLTYEFIPVFSQWLKDNDFPAPTICTYKPMEKTNARYRRAVVGLLREMRIMANEVTIARLSRIFGNMVSNQTLPGIAFGKKSCSIKWKVEAQEPQ